MAISDRMMQFRAPERIHERARDMESLFERSRSWVCRQAMDTFWTIMREPWKILPFILAWQEHLRKNGHYPVVQTDSDYQLYIPFPAHDGYSFRPKIGNYKEPA